MLLVVLVPMDLVEVVEAEVPPLLVVDPVAQEVPGKSGTKRMARAVVVAEAVVMEGLTPVVMAVPADNLEVEAAEADGRPLFWEQVEPAEMGSSSLVIPPIPIALFSLWKINNK
jgi:hypothetical protein